MLDLKKNTVAEWMLKEGYTEVTLMDFYRDIYPEEVLRADNKGSAKDEGMGRVQIVVHSTKKVMGSNEKGYAKPFFKDLSGLKMAIDKSNETYGLLEAAGAPPDRQDFRGLLDILQIKYISDNSIIKFLEKMVNPEVRTGEEQTQYVKGINKIIGADDFELVVSGKISNELIYKIYKRQAAKSNMKNLIFAPLGKKPDIVIDDAIAIKIFILLFGKLQIFLN